MAESVLQASALRRASSKSGILKSRNWTALAIATARLNQLATVLEMVRMGHGVSLIPAMAVTHNDRGRVYRSLEGKKPTRTIAVGWSAFHFRTKLFDRFVEWVKGSAAGKNGK